MTEIEEHRDLTAGLDYEASLRDWDGEATDEDEGPEWDGSLDEEEL